MGDGGSVHKEGSPWGGVFLLRTHKERPETLRQRGQAWEHGALDRAVQLRHDVCDDVRGGVIVPGGDETGEGVPSHVLQQ